MTLVRLLLAAFITLTLWAGCSSSPTAQNDLTQSTNAAPTTPLKTATPAPEMGAKAAPSIAHPSTIQEAFSNAPKRGTKSAYTDDDWREVLSAEEFVILRQEGTERAYSGAYWNTKEEGLYVCNACNAPLFTSSDKFKSGTGWPSYTQAVQKGRVGTHVDRRHGMVRTEIHCDHCDGHLGHVFQDGPEPTGLRYCVNSASVHFVPGDLSDIPKDAAASKIP